MIALFTCDEWKGSDSMRLIGIATNMEKVRISVAELLKNEVIEIEDGMEDFDWNVRSLNNTFKYLYLEEVEEDEIYTDGSYWV